MGQFPMGHTWAPYTSQQNPQQQGHSSRTQPRSLAGLSDAGSRRLWPVSDQWRHPPSCVAGAGPPATPKADWCGGTENLGGSWGAPGTRTARTQSSWTTKAHCGPRVRARGCPPPPQLGGTGGRPLPVRLRWGLSCAALRRRAAAFPPPRQQPLPLLWRPAAPAAGSTALGLASGPGAEVPSHPCARRSTVARRGDPLTGHHARCPHHASAAS
jgi:hypothetical protein